MKPDNDATREMYCAQRAKFAQHLRTSNTAALIPTNTPKTRNADCEYPFRPHSDFWYLTGFAEPEALLLMLQLDGEDRSVLFLRELDREREIWTGRRLGVEAAPAALGVDEAYPITAAWHVLPDLLAGYERIVTRIGNDPDFDRSFAELLEALRNGARSGQAAPVEIVDPAQQLHEQRLVKSEAEIDNMRRALEISTGAHNAAMAATQPGMGENEVEAILQYHFHASGSTGPAYTSIVAGGDNACILHYIENDQPLLDGELLLIDAGAEWEYYASDITRTFPIGGRFTPDQRALYEVVLAAQMAAIDQVQPGSSLQAVHLRAIEHMVDGMLRLGLMSGTRDGILADGSYRRFCVHKTSHWLGLDVHDCGAYALDGEPRALQPGMVLTVEPGLYVAADDETVDARWRGIGIRIEDDVLVTKGGHEVLSAGIPKSVADVEAACGSMGPTPPKVHAATQLRGPAKLSK
ncbi:MAG: Xaa-Pro aminopeptidase [Planctomycetota bacterium]|jgi:Xaa-Pro aminopeptidase